MRSNEPQGRYMIFVSAHLSKLEAKKKSAKEPAFAKVYTKNLSKRYILSAYFVVGSTLKTMYRLSQYLETKNMMQRSSVVAKTLALLK